MQMRIRFDTHRRSKSDDNDINVIFLNFFRKFIIIMKNLINNMRVIVNALFTHLRCGGMGCVSERTDGG